MSLIETKTIAAGGGTSQTVDILAFVAKREIPPHYFETPYYLLPAPGGERMYALLREILSRTGKIGIACVEIEARVRIAALIPQGQSLMLLTLRWDDENRTVEHDMKTRKNTAGLSLDVPDYALDDESEIDDALPAAVWRRRPHEKDGYAMRVAWGARPEMWRERWRERRTRMRRL